MYPKPPTHARPAAAPVVCTDTIDEVLNDDGRLEGLILRYFVSTVSCNKTPTYTCAPSSRRREDARRTQILQLKIGTPERWDIKTNPQAYGW